MRAILPPGRALKGLILFAALSCSSGAELKPLLAPDDLPPYPAATWPPSELTHTQQGTRQQQGGLHLAAANATPEEESLARELTDLKTRLAAAEEKAYRSDPLLLLSDLYTERAHDWVMAKHNDEFNASIKFSSSPGQGESSGKNRKVNQAVDLIDMILFIELASDVKFYPLFQSVYEALEMIPKKEGKSPPGFYEYQRNDKLIDYPAETPPQPVSSLPEYLAELKKRYPKLLAKLTEIRKSVDIPADAFAGIVYGELYRMLDGVAQLATEIRTPEEARDLRQQLGTKVIQLANLRAKNQQETTPNK